MSLAASEATCVFVFTSTRSFYFAVMQSLMSWAYFSMSGLVFS